MKFVLKPWDELTQDEQNLYVTALWQDGHTEQAIADFLKTTKGRIVRRRQTGLKLPTEGRPRPKPNVLLDRFLDLLDIHDMEDLEEQGITCVSPPTPRVPEAVEETPPPPALEQPATTEPAALPTHCGWPLATWSKQNPVLCGKPVVPGHRLCDEHLAIALRKRP